jgi:TPR repeat protein
LKYLAGDGYTKNESKGALLLQKATEAGHVEAQSALGVCYSTGRGVQRDDEKARAHFEAATEKGSLTGGANLGVFLIRGRGGEADPSRGIFLLEKSVKSGNLQSALVLGEIFYAGEHDSGNPDYQRAYDALLPVAEKGDPAAQNIVGVILKDDRMGEGRRDEARLWLERAALQTNGKACFNLSDYWDRNSTDRKSRVESLRWLLVAAELKEVLAMQSMNDIEPQLDPKELDLARQLAKLTWEQVFKKSRKPAESAE